MCIVFVVEDRVEKSHNEHVKSSFVFKLNEHNYEKNTLTLDSVDGITSGTTCAQTFVLLQVYFTVELKRLQPVVSLKKGKQICCLFLSEERAVCPCVCSTHQTAM